MKTPSPRKTVEPFPVGSRIIVDADFLAVSALSRFEGQPFEVTKVKNMAGGGRFLEVLTPEGKPWGVFTDSGVKVYREPKTRRAAR